MWLGIGIKEDVVTPCTQGVESVQMFVCVFVNTK